MAAKNVGRRAAAVPEAVSKLTVEYGIETWSG